jgi:hypothetical protein
VILLGDRGRRGKLSHRSFSQLAHGGYNRPDEAYPDRGHASHLGWRPIRGWPCLGKLYVGLTRTVHVSEDHTRHRAGGPDVAIEHSASGFSGFFLERGGCRRAELGDSEQTFKSLVLTGAPIPRARLNRHLQPHRPPSPSGIPTTSPGCKIDHSNPAPA